MTASTTTLRPRFQRRALIALLCLVTFGLSAKGAALLRQSVFELEQELGTQIKSIVHLVDPSALVFVRIKTVAPAATPLPGTPLSLSDLTTEASADEIRVQKVEVKILGDRARITSAVKQLVAQTTRSLGPPEIRVEALPQDLQPKPAAAPPATTVPREPSTPMELWLHRLRDPRAVPISLLLVGLALLLLGLLVTTGIARGSRRISTEIVTLAQLTTRRDEPASALAAASVVPAEATADTIFSSVGSARVISALSEDGLLMLLGDCYWSEFDSFASYVWKRIPVAKRRGLLARAEFLPEYTAYLSGIKEQAFGTEQEPCYLSPLPLWHLDNRALTDLVRRDPELRLHLSSLRIAKLELTVKERAELLRASLTARPNLSRDFGARPASPRRKLSPRLTLKALSLDEERELLALTDLPAELVEMTPSLAWLCFLPAKEVTAELGRYTPETLATAWVGPVEVLARLEALVPARKLALMKARLRTSPASRNANAYSSLHRWALTRWKDARPLTGAAPAKTTEPAPVASLPVAKAEKKDQAKKAA